MRMTNTNSAWRSTAARGTSCWIFARVAAGGHHGKECINADRLRFDRDFIAYVGRSSGQPKGR
jgi:hypothetical protein